MTEYKLKYGCNPNQNPARIHMDGKGYRAWLQKNKAITTPVKSISVVMSSFSDDDDTTTSIDVAEMAPDLIEALGIHTGCHWSR